MDLKMLSTKSQVNLKVLFLSAELAPIAKVGGLADGVGALPKALVELGVDVRICLPFYGSIDVKKIKPKKIAENIKVPINNAEEKISIWQIYLPKTKVCVYLIKHKYFDIKNIYGNNSSRQNNFDNSHSSSRQLCPKNSSKHLDILQNFSNKSDANLNATCKSYSVANPKTQKISNAERFSFFTRAAFETVKEIDFCPNVIHAHDSHMGLTANFVKTLNKSDDFFLNTKVLFTIHNLAYQGVTKTDIIDFTGIDPNLESVQNDAQDGNINFMVQGILTSDLITTVSPRYAQEILTYYQGAGLNNILAKRKKDISGILNGIDTDFFNPEIDKFIHKKYSIKTLDKKQENKIFLQKKLGLWPNKEKPLVGLVSRLVRQKGVELINDDFANLNCQFVFLGTGQKEQEQHLKKLAKKYPHQFSAQIMFDVKLAQQIYASADIFLMPSRFEPCGLGQMIAMRYGTIPVVRETGGLANTITNYESRITNFLKRNKANGFSFKNFNSGTLYKTLDRALDIYHNNPKQWHKLQINGMRTDFSWDKSAREYFNLYNKLFLS